MTTKIEWTETTWNPTTGCTRASAGCDNCYAVTMTKRLAAMGQEKYQGLVGNGHFNGVLQTHESELLKPLRWKKPRKVFVNSMSDLFHKAVPFEFIDKVFAVMALCPQHTFQVLTKRPERMAEYFEDGRPLWDKALDALPGAADIDVGGTHLECRRDHTDEYYTCAKDWPLPNVWLGTSIENQDAADKRISHLLRCPAAVRFLSCEPLIGPVDLTIRYPINQFGDSHNMNCLRGYGGWDGPREDYRINWVIVGGESGPKARPCNIEWIRSIVRQCADASVPCFVKQFGGYVVGSGCTGPGEHWPVKTNRVDINFETGLGWQFKLKDKKGGDMNEWPEDLRVRQFPAAT